ncbi:hypothetical protein LAZ67_X001696 [Cordylochernes scorpioides]|uniref:HTH CENPB-type domain-containing protein n=1 Tax=Cordylochernes scorpioides TaxID=51811 RepID=A0ABY6LTS6_9ARAC|nr:hypothetical protein LAZ67_X001696 [Cordylochernes scorpioides]
MPGHRKRRQFKQTDAFTRGMVIGLKRAGWSIHQIAADTHLGASTVHRLWRRWLEQGNVAIYRNVGATRVTSARVDRRILRQAVAAPQATCTAILQHVQDTLDHSISTRTISRRLVANGLHKCRSLRRLPLTPPNRRQRLEWCRARSTWMTEWHRVVFSDESGFCLSSDSRRVRVWRRRGERSNPAAIVERPIVRQRGIMVWGAIAYDSRSPLLRIQGTMTAQRYVDDVLRPVTLPYLQGVPNALYQQDNARPHTARISQQALQDVQMLPWPPYSPDLSPMEHVWDIIGRRLHALPQPRSEDELWQMVEREWRAIPQDAIRTLIDSLPRRVAACIAVREVDINDLHNIEEEKGIKGVRCSKRSHKTIKTASTSTSTEIARFYKKSTSTICTILKKKKELRELDAAKGVTRLSKQRPRLLEEVEKLILVWINEKQLAGDTITQNLICEKAKALYAELGSKIPCTSIENEVHADFKASKGWFENFKRRSGIHSVTRHGEGASSDAKAAETFTAEFEKLVVTECYLPQQVFNCDETGLFWKKIPKRTYITAEANTMLGHKPMKDRLTLLLCANASGDLKVKPLLVYHSENPRAFKKHKVQKSQLNVLWKSNTKAWVTRLLFVEWINEAFGPAVKKYLSEKKLPLRALLVMDNAPAHPPSLKDHLLDEFKFIEVRFLPPNTTPLLQPMDQQEPPIIDAIVSLGKTLGLEVNEPIIQELVEEEDQELTTNELIDLHREQHQEVKEVISSGEEEDENSLGSLPSDQIREICKMWETVQLFVAKHHPNKPAALRATDQFNDNAMSHFREILKKRQKQQSLDQFFDKIEIKK